MKDKKEGITELEDEELVRKLQKKLKRKPIIKLDEYFSNPETDFYFHEIYRRYQKRIEYYCLKFVNDKDLLEDLFHDIFIKIYLNIHRFRYSRSFKAWVYKIAHNNCVNYVRKHRSKELSILNRKVGFQSENSKEVIDFIENEEKNIEALLINEDIRVAIDRAIRKLPYEYINVFMLKNNAGLTYEEVAKILKVSSRSVKTIYQNSLQFIKQELDGHNYNLGDVRE